MNFELIIYFNEKHIQVTVINAKNFEEAKLIAFNRFGHKGIQKIEPYFKKGREYVN